MKRALVIVGSLAVVALLFAVRPGSEFAQVQTLNGSPRRWTLPDGGQSILVASAGQACADLTGSGAQVVMFIPEQPINACFPTTSTTGLNAWDGGCNTVDTDPNFGVPLQAWVPQYVTLDVNTSQICAASDAGAFRVPLYRQY